MDLKRKYLHLIPSFLVVTSLILSACQDGGQNRVRIAKGGSTNGRIEERTQLTPEQTRHSKDPLSLEPYKKFLAPILSRMDAEAATPWSALFKLKRWIQNPADNKKDVPSPVSISMSREYGEYARQTMYDVFIDDRIYEKQKENEQADTILNEFLTTLYTFKNFSDDELCSLVTSQYKDAEGCVVKIAEAEIVEPSHTAEEERVLSKKILTAEKPVEKRSAKNDSDKSDSESASDNVSGQVSTRKNEPPQKGAPKPSVAKKALDREDYLNIDYVKKYILGKGLEIRHDALVSTMRENGFDVRVFTYRMIPKAAKDPLKIEGETIEGLFAQAEALNQTTQNCFFIGSEVHSECQIKARRSPKGDPENKTRFSLFQFALKIGEKDPFLSETVYQPETVKISKFQVQDTKEEIFLIPLVSVGVEKPTVGAAFRMNYMISAKTIADAKETWALEGIISVPGTITKIMPDEKEKGFKCEGHQIAEMKNEATDILFVAASDKYLGLIKEKVKAVSGPIEVSCW